MNVTLRKAPSLLENTCILTCQKRFRGKINIQRPKEPHFERAKVIEFVKPYFPKKSKGKPLIELCDNIQPKKVDTVVDKPYINIIAKECLNWFNHSRLIALFHLNPMSGDEQFKAYVQFKKQNMHMKLYGKEVLKIALSNTKYETFLEHYVSHNIMVFSTDPDVKHLLKVNKKFPQMVLLSAILEGKYLSKDELVTYGQIPNLQVAQARLVQVLENCGGQIVQHLTQSQNNLVAQLREIAKQRKEES